MQTITLHKFFCLDRGGSDIGDHEDDASSTHSNTSYSSVSEVAHDNRSTSSYPAHHRSSYPREHTQREYSNSSNREPQREGTREYFPTSPVSLLHLSHTFIPLCLGGGGSNIPKSFTRGGFPISIYLGD